MPETHVDTSASSALRATCAWSNLTAIAKTQDNEQGKGAMQNGTEEKGREKDDRYTKLQ